MRFVAPSGSIRSRVKHVLMSLDEIVVFIVGTIIGSIIADAYGYGYHETSSIFIGIIVSFIVALLMRRKMRLLKHSHFLECWSIQRAERLQNPKRWKRTTRVQRILLWVPSAIGACVLFSFPPETHLLYTRAGNLLDYHISLPWNWVVIPMDDENREVAGLIISGCQSGFGLTPFGRDPIAAASWFECIRTEKLADAFQKFEESRNDMKEPVRRELLAGDKRIICWEDSSSQNNPYFEAWKVRCITPIEEKRRAFRASYDGPKESLPEFYNILRSLQPAN
jgi:hypothetical protein